MPRERLLIPLLLIVALPLLAIALMSTLATDVETVEQRAANTAFFEARERFKTLPEVLRLNRDGSLQVVVEQTDFSRPEASELHILKWREQNHTLAYTHIPIWLLKLEGPVTRYILRSSGFDLAMLPLDAHELQVRGVELLLDHIYPNGDRLMLWLK